MKRMSLQSQLAGSFLLMGLIVAAVGGISWQGTTKLSREVSTLSDTTLPSISGLWAINEGQTQIESAELKLLNPDLSDAEQEAAEARIESAWQQIDQGFERYEATERTEEEEERYQSLLITWAAWEQNHQQYIEHYDQWQALQESNADSAQTNAAFKALEARSSSNTAAFTAAANDLLELIAINEEVGKAATESAKAVVALTQFWSTTGAVAGFGSAVGLGMVLSIAIAKPLGRKVSGVIQSVVSSAAEIAATIEQQEKSTTLQAASVNETTTTIDELGASSRQSAEQAEAAASGAQQALSLAEGGARAVDRTLQEMDLLREKVDAIADQILRLSEQTSQIGSISGLVSDLANQTNMLALNAAVEAVRAGEHGKGFAVVSGEIRKLADQSKKSTEKINALVSDIQNAINSTVMVTDEGTKTVEESVAIANETAEAFAGVTDAMNNVVLNSQQISLNVQQQAVAIQQVVSAMNSLNGAAQETASGIGQIKVGTHRLNEAATNLKVLV
jgi:hypothetical protein